MRIWIRLPGARARVTRSWWWLLPLLIVISFLSAVPAEADTGSWSPPTRISADDVAMNWNWFPAIAADNFGNVHVVWNGLFPDTRVNPNNQQAHDDLAAAEAGAGGEAALMAQLAALYYSRSTNGQAWTKPVDIGLAWWGTAIRSSLAVDLAGRLNLIRDGTGRVTASRSEGWDINKSIADRELWYSQAVGMSGNQVHGWSDPVRFSRSDVGYYSDIAIDSKGVIHAIYTESQVTWGIYYSHSADGGKTWSNKVPLDPNQPVWWYRASLTVDAWNRVHVAWEVLDDAGTYGKFTAMKYAISSDGGETWQTTIFAPSDASSAGSQQPTIGVDGNGTILLVYRDPMGETIAYRTSTDGQAWSVPATLPGVTSGVARPYDKYDTATDSAGHVHLVAVGYPDRASEMALLHFEWNGQVWARPQIIVNAPAYPEYPRIAVGEGNKLHVAWFDRDKASIDANPVGGVWYSTAPTNAPSTAEPPSGLATSLSATAAPTSPDQPTGIQLVVPSSTAIPVPPAQPPPDRVSDLPLLVAIAPVVTILLIAVLVRLRAPNIPR